MGFSSQAGLASLRARLGTPEYYTPPLSWTDEAEVIYDHLVDVGSINFETGEHFTVRQIDSALQSAVESFRLREGARLEEITSRVWPELAEDVAHCLGLSADDLLEVLS